MTAPASKHGTTRALWWLASLSAAICLGDELMDDFSTVSAWHPHADGGQPVEIRSDPQGVQGPCLRLIYRDAEPHWGNVARTVRVPPQATGLRFQIRVQAASPATALHLWFFEADGDAYVLRLRPAGKELAALPAGWHSVTVPFSSLNYQPRGDKARAFLSIDRMLFGCNFGDLDLAIDDLQWVEPTGEAMPLPRRAPAPLERGAAGTVAILAEPSFPTQPGHAQPEHLATILRQAGFGVSLLRAGDVCDPAVLSRPDLDILVVPCSPYYPQDGRDALLGFLRAGGAFVTLGGYAFDDLVVLTAAGWQRVEPAVRAQDMDAPRPALTAINTRSGRPGDTMGLDAEQIGVFDPSYELRRSAALVAAPTQFLLPASWRTETPVQGFAAIAMTGSNSPVFPEVHGRWLPLVQAVDHFGRSRGPVLALVQNHAGPYAQAGWAFCGVTDQNLFDGRFPELEAALVAAMHRLATPRFLHSLRTDLACYRQGEAVTISVQARLPARTQATVRLEVDGNAIADLPATGPEATLTTTWRPATFARDLSTVRAILQLDGQEVDQLDTAFSVWNPAVVAAGPRLTQRQTLFEIDGQPTFICGANQTGMMWYSAHEDPLVWQRDFEQMSDYALNLLRVLHFSPFAQEGQAATRSRDPLHLRTRPLATQRQTDAMVQLAQQHRVAFFLTLHDWMPVELNDEELEAQRQWARFWAERYREVPGILYDIQNEPSVGLPDRPDVRAWLEAWLSARYGSLDQARDAWGLAPGQPWPLALDRQAAWESLQARDLDRFRAELFRRWTAANLAGVRVADPDALVTVGHLQTLTAADKLTGAAGLDFTNTHFYGSVADYRAILKLIDRRFSGQAFSLGEFGAREAHDARTHGQTGDPAAVSVPYYLAVGHYALGMGAAFIACWDWKDFRDCVFPWGVTHADLVAKPVLEAYRNQALLFRAVRAQYQAPAVTLLIPDSHRFGARSDVLHAALARAANGLFSANAAFGVIHEEALDQLPDATRALVWPLPYCPSDETFTRVRQRVAEGGALLFTGDVRYAADRQPSRGDRLTALGLPSGPAPQPPFPPDATRSRTPLSGRCGRGQVVWVPFPLELDATADLGAVYRQFLDQAGVRRLRLEPDDGSVHAFEIPVDGGAGLVLVHDGPARRRVTVTGSQVGTRLEIDLDGRATGFALRLGDRIVAAEAQGELVVEGRVVLRATGHQAILALDGQDLAACAQRLVLPFGPGTVDLGADADDRPLQAEVGEFRAGAWRTLATASLPGGTSRAVTIDANSPFDLRLIAAPDALAAARRAAVRLLRREP